MEPENQKKYTIISIGIIILLAFGVWYMFAGRSDVSDIRERADNTRAELTDARTAQQREASDLTEAGRAVERSEQAVTDSKDSNRELQERERTDSEIIRESQSTVSYTHLTLPTIA